MTSPAIVPDYSDACPGPVLQGTLRSGTADLLVLQEVVEELLRTVADGVRRPLLAGAP